MQQTSNFAKVYIKKYIKIINIITNLHKILYFIIFHPNNFLFHRKNLIFIISIYILEFKIYFKLNNNYYFKKYKILNIYIYNFNL